MSSTEDELDVPVVVVNEKAQKASEELTNGMLMDQLEELEEQKTKLLLNLKECKEKYEQQKSDQTDIYYYLNKKLDENYETIALLEEQILNEQTQREVHERKLEKRIEDLEAKLVADELKYKNKLKEAEEKLQKLKEFSDNKDELERNFEKLLETLETERKHYSELVDENERKSIRERDRFRKDCLVQFEEYKQKLQDEADDKLSSKTKKTLKTNKMIKTELTYQSKQADQVLVYNKKVLDKDRELRQELELTQTTQKEMVRRLVLYQRLIKQLNEKVSNQEAAILEITDTANNDIKQKDDAIEDLRNQLIEAKTKQSSCTKYKQDALLEFLSNKYKEIEEITGTMNRDASKAFVRSNGDKILNELLVNALQRFPDRFAQFLEDRSVGLFPPLFDNVVGKNHEEQLLTGISAWDSARSSKKNWWNSFSHEQESAKNQGIQTEGRVSQYPAGSKWLDTPPGAAGSENTNTQHRHIVDRDNIRHTSKSSKNTRIVTGVDECGVERFEIDVSASKESLKLMCNDDMFSPLSDPLRRASKKKGGSLSISSSKSARSRK